MSEQVLDMDTAPSTSPLYVAANITSAGAIAFSWFAIITQIASLVAVGLAAIASAFAIVYYILAILNDTRVKKWRNERRLRRIAYLKARVVGLEAKQIFDEAVTLHHLPTEVVSGITSTPQR